MRSTETSATANSREGTSRPIRRERDIGKACPIYETFGTGDDVVVLLHGLLLNTKLSRGFTLRLAGGGRRVILLDRLQVPQAVLGGVSLGANVSLLAATMHPGRVRALVVEMPVLVIGRRADLIHPFSDAENLTEQIPGARLVRGVMPFGMRVFPKRMLGEVESFLDEVAPITPTTVGT